MVLSRKTDNSPAVIGTTEFIVLPESNGAHVPAKIDTGADGSSIWASDIEEHDGELSFVLFAPSSAFYTGQIITTNKYRVTRVKNSFGVDEFRYRVWLRIIVADKRYKTSFTLANRSNSRYPILLGKRFLNKRFLVDVSKSNLMTALPRNVTKTAVVLASKVNEDSRAFYEKVARDGEFDLKVHRYDELEYSINEAGVPLITLPNGEDLASAAVVFFRSYKRYSEWALAIARYLQFRHVAVIDEGLAGAPSQTKLSELFALATESIPVPATRLITPNDGVDYATLAAAFGTEFVLKDADADRGRANFFVRDEVSFREAMSRLADVELLLAQQYIPNDGFYRVLVMGRDIIQIVHRSAVKHRKDPLRDHLNNPPSSQNAAEVAADDADPEMLAIALRACIATKRFMAGVDMVQDRQTGRWYIIEVNASPALRKGINIERKQHGLAAFLKKEGQL